MDAGLTDRLHILPEVPVHDMTEWYRILDLFVAPQRREDLRLTPPEIMVCGVPVIATTGSAFSERTSTQTGTLIAPQDTPAMTQAITRCARDATLRQIQGTAARTHAEANFRIEQEANAILVIQKTLLKRP